MKKLLLALGLTSVLALAACSEGEDTESNEEQTEEMDSEENTEETGEGTETEESTEE